MSKQTQIVVPSERIARYIYQIRGQKVMLSHDLAELYSVETRVLVQAVKRNIRRFPSDFMFQLSKREHEAFTEQGVAMLSSVLRSKRAVEVNIAIMRTFVKLREILAHNAALRRKIEAMERKYDEQFKHVFNILSEMILAEAKPKARVGILTEIQAEPKQKGKRKAKS